jgi:hypothetical protein
MRSKFNIYVYIYYTLDIENEQQLIPMSCDVPGVGFLIDIQEIKYGTEAFPS